MRRFSFVNWTLAALVAVVLAVGLAGVGRAADVSAGYQSAVRQFERLRDDPASAGRRDLWKALDARLAALAKAAGQDRLAARILYYQAWTNAELADRSYLDADYEAAAALYGRAAAADPKNAWADDALLRRAVLLKERLQKPAEARADLETVVRRYPKGDMAARAAALLAGLDAPAAPGKGQDKAEKAAPDKAAPVAPATSARPATLIRAAVAESSTGGRVTLTFDRETTYRYQLLDQKRASGEPVRLLYIDCDNTRTGEGLPSEKRFEKGAVSRLRAGYFTPETVRVVLELDDVRQYELHAESSPFRVVLDLTGAPAGQEAGKAPEYRAEASRRKEGGASKSMDWLGNLFHGEEASGPAPPSRKGQAASGGGPAAKARPAPSEPAPGASASGGGADPAKVRLRLPTLPDGRPRGGSLVEQFGLSVKTIMIDPGHGGKDPGAQGLFGVTEKDVNLQFAKVLGEALRKNGFNVLYTRTSDVFIPLETRTEMANTKGADLFVSIHCNSHGEAESSGLETYSLNLATSQDAVRVAARENAASQKKISDLQAILTDLMLSAKTAESKDLARLVQKRALGGLRGRYATRDRGPHEAPFFVLIGANMPAVLVELGYVTNPDEARRLTSDTYQQALARGMADGIAAYKKRIERYANL
ncbi:cell wall hydrolase/autolysin [Solidesulfovibrio carbinoliphilus subsp. oakridgensis]|uniref:N-acetylmuramoyl-L-alanine amidase n=1 Tax=Solidesulfovibrio carbinoliphilus subsp. oakridgensis TaxID=694327 RepID=G7Q9L6_9BACT|nr:N-acetylmuramoyl-L-alanine amidase [Solidesulfovibrio carbinoliphilus]EHJ48656.1 cell wall hydrolase/autolysin [Solidesulfovibrio carbinoliphilus subsp. oakridgensis]